MQVCWLVGRCMRCGRALTCQSPAPLSPAVQQDQGPRQGQGTGKREKITQPHLCMHGAGAQHSAHARKQCGRSNSFPLLLPPMARYPWLPSASAIHHMPAQHGGQWGGRVGWGGAFGTVDAPGTLLAHWQASRQAAERVAAQ